MWSGFLGPGLALPRLAVIRCVLKRLGGRKEEQCKLNYLYRTLSSRKCSHRMTLRAHMPPQGLWTYSNSKGTLVFVFAREKGITWKLFSFTSVTAMCFDIKAQCRGGSLGKNDSFCNHRHGSLQKSLLTNAHVFLQPP